MPAMPSLTHFLIRRYASLNTSDASHMRARYATLEAATSVLFNLVIFVLKFALANVSGSISLLADAFHTLGDLVSSGVVWFGARAACKPADQRHPFGHGRAEPIATLVIAMLLVVAAIEFGRVSYLRVCAPQPIRAGWIVITAMALSIVAKEWLARFSGYLGRESGSPMLEADAWHHRSDALAAALVVVAAIASRYGYHRVDGVLGLGVAALIGLAGLQMGWKMMSVLLGEAPDTETIAAIDAAAFSVRGVRAVHDVQVHDYGSRKHVSLHVEVAPHASTQQSHDTATAVENAIQTRLNMEAVVHVDPAQRGQTQPHLAIVRDALERAVQSHDPVKGFHGLHCVQDAHGTYCELHMQFDPRLPLSESHALVHDIASHIAQDTGVPKVNIHVEPAEEAEEPPQGGSP